MLRLYAFVEAAVGYDTFESVPERDQVWVR